MSYRALQVRFALDAASLEALKEELLYVVETLRAQVRTEGLPRIAFPCSSYHQNSTLYPVILHVERLLDFQRDDAPATKLDKLLQGLQTYHQPLHEVVPLFASLLSVPPAAGFGHANDTARDT
jgi:hypothetical protein